VKNQANTTNVGQQQQNTIWYSWNLDGFFIYVAINAKGGDF
jgi:hypothetical protein